MNARDVLQNYYDHLTVEHGEQRVSPSWSVNGLPYRNVKAHHAKRYPDCGWTPRGTDER